MELSDETKQKIMAHTLKNAIEHGGTPSAQAVLGKILASNPQLRQNILLVKEQVERAIQQVAKLTLEEQRREFEKYSLYIEPKPKTETKQKPLPELPSPPSKVVTRFAPNPDGPIHIGNLRAAVLSHAYARMYNGTFILRLEDTDPKVKPPLLSAYEWIQQDLKWLGLEWDQLYIQSDRFEIYYEYAEKLVEGNHAYVCECTPEEFRSYKLSGRACPHRSRKDSLDLLQKMIAGEIGEGKAVLRLKTAMDDPNPALRDPPLLRVIDTNKTPHPRTGSQYKAFPLYNFSAALDDSLMGVTLVLRGKEHLTNGIIQATIQDKLGLQKPMMMEFGRLNLEGYILSKSKIKMSLRSKEFQTDFPTMFDGWDDPRLATVMGLRRRGIQPKALVELMLEVGPKPVEASISWDNLAALNRKIVEPVAKRFFAVFDPIRLSVSGLPVTVGEIAANVKVHPSRPELGDRKIVLPVHGGQVSVMVSKADIAATSREVRLMDLFNVTIQEITESGAIATYKSREVEEAKLNKYPIIQWVPESGFVKALMYRPEGLRLEKLEGAAEAAVVNEAVGNIVQLVRIGYARIDGKTMETNDPYVRFIYTHD